MGLGGNVLLVFGIKTMCLGSFCGPLKNGTVVPSASSMSSSFCRMSSTRATQKSQPGTRSVSKRSMTLNLTISDCDPTFTDRLIIPSIDICRILASFMLIGYLGGQMFFCSLHRIGESFIKHEVALMSRTALTRLVSCLVRTL